MAKSGASANGGMAVFGHGMDGDGRQSERPYPMPRSPSRGDAAIREIFHVPGVRLGEGS